MKTQHLLFLLFAKGNIMNLGTVKTMLANAGSLIDKNSPTILTVVGVAGVIGTAVATWKGTNNAIRILNEEEMLRKDHWVEGTGEDRASYPAEITPREAVAFTWKCYIPAAALGLVTITAIVGANRISLRRQAALASLYTVAEKAVRTYEEKIVETLGEKKAEEIKQEIAKDAVAERPIDRTAVINTGRGTTLMLDGMSGRYFYSDLELVRKIVNDFNKDILSHGYKSLNEFYDQLDLEHTQIGDIVGWGHDYEFFDIDYRPVLAANGQPCIFLDYKVEPENR